MKFCYLSLLTLALMFSPGATAADGQELNSTVWITEPVDWVYRPDDSQLAPLRSGSASILYLHSDGTASRLDATLIEGLQSDNRFLVISQGDGFLLYLGTWKTNSTDGATLEYQLLIADKAISPDYGRIVRDAIRINHGVLEFSETKYFAPESLFPVGGEDFGNTYLQYVCGILTYGGKEIAECKETQDIPDEQFISYPNRTIEEWKPENAVNEAEYDIKNNKIKIYYSGTITSGPVGVSPEDAHLIENLPIADGGVGCKVSNSELRTNQSAYAKKYNEIIMLHLKKTV